MGSPRLTSAPAEPLPLRALPATGILIGDGLWGRPRPLPTRPRCDFYSREGEKGRWGGSSPQKSAGVDGDTLRGGSKDATAPRRLEFPRETRTTRPQIPSQRVKGFLIGDGISGRPRSPRPGPAAAPIPGRGKGGAGGVRTPKIPPGSMGRGDPIVISCPRWRWEGKRGIWGSNTPKIPQCQWEHVQGCDSPGETRTTPPQIPSQRF